MSDSQISLYRRENEARFSGPEQGNHVCITCKREMVEQFTDLWYVDGRRISDGPLDAPRGEKCCSRRCLSQYVYDTAPEDVKSLMRSFALVVNEWSEAVRLRRSDRSLNLDWALRHSYLTHLMPRLNLEVADDAMEDFAEELIGRDAVLGTDDPPRWYMDAITPVAPAKPVEFVHLGLEKIPISNIPGPRLSYRESMIDAGRKHLLGGGE
jgi:hypothetical protein